MRKFMRGLSCILLLCTLPILPLCSAARQPERYLAITFDDGPSGRFTERLLDGLSERGVHATFFLCGYRIDQYPELAERIAREGHEIGIHGDAHKFFTQLSPSGVCADLKAAEEKIESAAGQSPTLLRPPGGLFDMEVLRQTVCAELPVVLWSLDTEDWHRTNSAAIASDIVRDAKNGDIILMHDMSDSSVNAALSAIDALTEKGFCFLTVSELAQKADTPLTGGQAYYRFSIAEKKDSSSEREAFTEPWTKPGFPPPRPEKFSFRRRASGRTSPSACPMAYL